MSEQALKRRLALVALAIGITAGLAGAAPAGAYLKDFQVVSGNSVSSSSTLKTVLAPCPSGKTVLGTGGVVVPASSNLGLNRLYPNFEQGFAFDGGTESDAVASLWHVEARALCVAQTAVVPSTGGPGYAKNPSWPSASSLLNSASVHEAVAHCPAGNTAIGGGGAAFNAAGEMYVPTDVALDNSQRVMGGTAWRARAHEVDATTAKWKVVAYAICADFNPVTTPAYYIGPKEDAVFSPNAGPPAPATGATGRVAVCPQGGTRVIGGGVQLLGATGPTPPPDVVLTSSYPVVSSGASGWQAAARDTDPPGPAFRLQVRVVCG